MHYFLADPCLAEAAGARFRYDPALALLCVLIAGFGSYTSMEMTERRGGARGGGAAAWQAASAAALGGGIWAARFVADQAVRAGLPTDHPPGPAAASLFVLVLAACFGSQLYRAGSRARIAAAAAAIGPGAAAVHYGAIAAAGVPDHLACAPGSWRLSAVAGIAAAAVALFPAFDLRLKWQRGLAALAMAAAICGTFFTGMAAGALDADPPLPAPAGVPRILLALFVGGLAMALLLYALVLVAADRRRSAAQGQQAGALRRANEALRRRCEEFDAALGGLPRGLAFFDRDQRLLVSNARYGEIFGLSDDDRRPGRRLPEIIDARIAAGTFPAMTKAAYMARGTVHALTSQPFEIADRLPDGRIVAMRCRPLADGGWVVAHEDISGGGPVPAGNPRPHPARRNHCPAAAA